MPPGPPHRADACIAGLAPPPAEPRSGPALQTPRDLLATGEEALAGYVATWRWEEEIPDALHGKLRSAFRDYILTGGMPAAVATWARGRSMLECTEVHHRLVATFREDFQKDGGRVPAERLRRVFDAIPRFLGQKFVFSRIEGEDRARELKAALDLLLRAGVCTRVSATDATGTPLGAEVREREFKVVFLDTGLVSAALGLSFEDVDSLEDLALVDRGAIFEQAVGQMLRGAEPRFKEAPAVLLVPRAVRRIVRDRLRRTARAEHPPDRGEGGPHRDSRVPAPVHGRAGAAASREVQCRSALPDERGHADHDREAGPVSAPLSPLLPGGPAASARVGCGEQGVRTRPRPHRREPAAERENKPHAATVT